MIDRDVEDDIRLASARPRRRVSVGEGPLRLSVLVPAELMTAIDAERGSGPRHDRMVKLLTDLLDVALYRTRTNPQDVTFSATTKEAVHDCKEKDAHAEDAKDADEEGVR